MYLCTYVSCLRSAFCIHSFITKGGGGDKQPLACCYCVRASRQPALSHLVVRIFILCYLVAVPAVSTGYNACICFSLHLVKTVVLRNHRNQDEARFDVHEGPAI